MKSVYSRWIAVYHFPHFYPPNIFSCVGYVTFSFLHSHGHSYIWTLSIKLLCCDTIIRYRPSIGSHCMCVYVTMYLCWSWMLLLFALAQRLIIWEEHHLLHAQNGSTYAIYWCFYSYWILNGSRDNLLNKSKFQISFGLVTKNLLSLLSNCFHSIVYCSNQIWLSIK